MITPSASPDPPLGSPDPPRDWFEFWVRFIGGALLGLLLSGVLWLRLIRLELSWLMIPAGGLLFGLVTGRYGDRFWNALRYLRLR